jgi:two-component system cell cycle sensor histidine kinase/response regulator CckA
LESGENGRVTLKPTYEELSYKVDQLENELHHYKHLQELLKEGKRFPGNFFDAISDAVIVFDTETMEVLNVNLSAQELLGYSQEELKKFSLKSFSPDNSEPVLQDMVSRIERAREGKPQVFEWKIKNSNGKTFWAEVNIRRAEIGGRERMLAIFKDISKWKEAAEFQRESEERLSLVVEHSHDGIIIIDDSYHFIYVNNEFCKMLEYPREELINHNFQEFLDEESLEIVTQTYKRRQRGEDVPERYEFNIVRKDGEKRRVEISSTVFLTSSGKVATVAHLLDITDRTQAEEKMRESEERYRLLAENVGDVIWTMDLEKGGFTYLSPSGEGLLGYPVEEVMNISVEKILTPESFKKAIILFSKELEKQQLIDSDKTEGPMSVELEHVRKDGSLIWAELSVTFLRDEKGNLCELLGVSRDITARKEAEEALRQSEEKYRTILENIEDGYIEIDLDGNFTFVNRMALEMLGYTHEEMIGMNYREYTSEATAGKMYKFFHEIYLTGKPAYLMDYDVIRKDGSIRVNEMSVSLIKNINNNPIGFRGIARDVTQRRLAEETLRQSEEKYRTILENIEDGYFEVDLMGNLNFFNDSFARIWGYPKEELQGMHNSKYSSQETVERVFKIFRQIYLTGNPAQISDYEIFRKDKSTRILEIYASLMRDSQSVPVGFRGIARDITERKRLEQRFLQAQKMESVGTLAGGIAHDFNNLLMGILGNISMMLMGRDELDKDYERLKNIEQYVQRGSELTKRLLGFARGGKYEVKPTDLKKFITNSSEMFGRTKKEIQIHRKFAEDLWAVEVDQGQMEQVLLNLFVNAWQAMPEGGHLYLEGVNVELGSEDVGPHSIEPGKYVMITVTDTGIGIDDATRVRIFDPFFTTKDRSRGTGLGLASVYGIVKNHGGFIAMESEEGVGTSFHIYLPATFKKVEGDRKENEEIQQGQGTILLVDDEEMILDVGSQMLKKIGYDVLTAPGGREAVSVYQNNCNRIDIVILDMIMPEMGGGQTYESLKEIDPEVNVLLSSGYSRDGQAEEILKKGCKGFIQKPFNMKDLSHKIAEILVR